jgi:hypothetical protein
MHACVTRKLGATTCGGSWSEAAATCNLAVDAGVPAGAVLDPSARTSSTEPRLFRGAEPSQAGRIMLELEPEQWKALPAEAVVWGTGMGTVRGGF